MKSRKDQKKVPGPDLYDIERATKGLESFQCDDAQSNRFGSVL